MLFSQVETEEAGFGASAGFGGGLNEVKEAVVDGGGSEAVGGFEGLHFGEDFRPVRGEFQAHELAGLPGGVGAVGGLQEVAAAEVELAPFFRAGYLPPVCL